MEPIPPFAAKVPNPGDRIVFGMPVEKLIAWGARLIAVLLTALAALGSWSGNRLLSEIEEDISALQVDVGEIRRDVGSASRENAGQQERLNAHDLRLAALEAERRKNGGT